ncbi:MAG: phage scaffolding protein [Eubacteriales bacterium]|nr:phage scaffolding protein [Eubacteriales bacterium]
MAYEFLKALYGTPKEGEQPRSMTYAELEAAIDAADDLKLINLSDGGYVTQADFDAKALELDGIQQQLTTANETIKSYKDMDIDGIKQSATNWETKYNTETQALQDKLAAQSRAHAEEMLVSSYRYPNKAARVGVLAAVRAKKLPLENGELMGGKAYMEELQKDADYSGAFVVDTPPVEPPANLPYFSKSTGDSSSEPPKKKPSLLEMMKFKNEHPDARIFDD